MQDDDDASARLSKVNEAFEDAAPLRDVLLAVCREFRLTHAAQCLDRNPAEPVGEDADMADASSAGAEGAAAHGDDDDGEAEQSEEEESDGDEEDDDIWSAAERDDKDMMVSPCCGLAVSIASLLVRPRADSGLLSTADHEFITPPCLASYPLEAPPSKC